MKHDIIRTFNDCNNKIFDTLHVLITIHYLYQIHVKSKSSYF